MPGKKTKTSTASTSFSDTQVKGKGDDLPASPIKVGNHFFWLNMQVIIADVKTLKKTFANQHSLQTKASPTEKMDSKKRKASEDEKVVEKKAKASPAK